MNGIEGKINSLKRKWITAKDKLRTEKVSLSEAVIDLGDTTEASIIAQDIAQQIQQKAHAQIAGVVTHCIRSVFGDEYEFKIRFEQKSSKTTAQLLLIRNGCVVENPTEEDSGGVIDVASFALRLTCLILSKPKKEKLLMLDEPFRFVSKGYRENVRQLLLQLTEDFGLQVVMVTHIEELKVGKVIEL